MHNLGALDSKLGNNHAMVQCNSVVFTHNGLWLSLRVSSRYTCCSAWSQ